MNFAENSTIPKYMANNKYELKQVNLHLESAEKLLHLRLALNQEIAYIKQSLNVSLDKAFCALALASPSFSSSMALNKFAGFHFPWNFLTLMPNFHISSLTQLSLNSFWESDKNVCSGSR